jgi:hypothetical protein
MYLIAADISNHFICRPKKARKDGEKHRALPRGILEVLEVVQKIALEVLGMLM